MTNLLAITFVSLSLAQPQELYQEYRYPFIITNITDVTNRFFTNYAGFWSNSHHRISLRWNGENGASYVVETSSSLQTWPYPGDTNVGQIGDRWRPCSVPMTNHVWTSAVPHERALFRIRKL